MPAVPLSSASRWKTSTARPACKATIEWRSGTARDVWRKRGARCLPDQTATWGRHMPRARWNAVGCRTTKESKCTPTTTPLGESACVAMDDANSTARSVNVRVVFSANCRIRALSIRALSILRHGATPCCDMFDNALSGHECQICFDSREESVLSVGVRDAGLCGCRFFRVCLYGECESAEPPAREN